MLFDKLKDVWDNKNAQGFLDLHHDDFEWYFHSNGRVIKKSDWTSDDILKWMNRTTVTELRCVYENEDIHVRHGIAHFESGDKEAVMTVVLKKDGLLWRMETGSTPLQPND